MFNVWCSDHGLSFHNLHLFLFLDNSGSAHELWWFFLSCLSTVFITEVVIISTIDFLFPVAFYRLNDNQRWWSLGWFCFFRWFLLHLHAMLIAGTVNFDFLPPFAPILIISFGFAFILAYDHFLWCQYHIIMQSELLLVCDDFCFSCFFEFSLQLCAILI
jgi:hypothetical protein